MDIIKFKEIINSKKQMIFYILSIILFAIIAYECFYNLDKASIQDWDEARHGINAYEMMQTGNMIINTYNYETDYWNLKPTLSYYCIMLGYLVFGYTLVGMRIYSAIAMMFIVVIVYAYCVKRIGKFAGIFVLLGFASCSALLFEHAARFGDADILFCLFFVIAVIALIEMRKRNWMLYISCLCFAFAFLTKGFHAGTIAMIVITFLIVSRQLFKLSFKQLVIGFLCVTAPIILWAAFRYMADGSVFIESMFSTDVVSRITDMPNQNIESKYGSFYFLLYLFGKIDIYIYLLLIVSCFTDIRKKVNKNDFLIATILAICIPLVLFSICAMNLYWYILCIFPILILLSGYCFQMVKNNIKKSNLSIVIILIVTIISGYCIMNNIDYVSSYKPNDMYLSEQIFDMTSRDMWYNGYDVYLKARSDETRTNFNRFYGINKNEFAQNEVLALELSANLKAKSGSLDAFENDEEALIIINKMYMQLIKCEYEIIAKSENYYLISHVK